jgi:hypothetical protein
MYVPSDDDPLISDVGIYILDKLGTFQNMSAVYKVTAETDLHDYVSGSTILVDNTRIYRFSKELLAYLEMCVAFSPYYRQDDPRTSGAMDQYFRDALQAYAAVPYKDLHAYLERRLGAWYFKFKPESSAVVDVEDAGLGDVVTVGAVDGEVPPIKRARFSLTYGSPAAAAPTTTPAVAGSAGEDSESEEASGEASGGRTARASPILTLATSDSAK